MSLASSSGATSSSTVLAVSSSSTSGLLASSAGLLGKSMANLFGIAQTRADGDAGYFLVQIHGGHTLPRVDGLVGRIDAFFVVELEDSFCRTSVCKKNLNPSWKDAKMYFHGSGQSRVIIQLWDYEKTRKDRVLGGAALDSRDWTVHPKVDSVKLPLTFTQAYTKKLDKKKPPCVSVSVRFVRAAKGTIDDTLREWAPFQFGGGLGSAKRTGPMESSSGYAEPLHIMHIFQAVELGDFLRVKALFEEHDVDPSYRTPALANGFSPFLVAVGLGHKTICEYFHREMGKKGSKHASELLCKGDLKGQDSPLLVAAAFGQVDILLWLLEQESVSITKSNNDGNTALHIAALNGQLVCFKALVKVLAQRGIEGTHRQQNKLGSSPIFLAARAGHLNVVRYLVEELGVNPNEERAANGNTVAVHAAFYGQHDVIRYLATVPGFEPNAYNNLGNTALHFAFRNRQWTTGYLLLGLGCSAFQRNYKHEPDPQKPVEEIFFVEDAAKSFLVDVERLYSDNEKLRMEVAVLTNGLSATKQILKRKEKERRKLARAKAVATSSQGLNLSDSSSSSSSTHQSKKKKSSQASAVYIDEAMRDMQQRTETYRSMSTMFQGILGQAAQSLEKLTGKLLSIADFEEFLVSFENLVLFYHRVPALIDHTKLVPLVDRLLDPAETRFWQRRVSLLLIVSQPRLHFEGAWLTVRDLFNATAKPLPSPSDIARRRQGITAAMLRSPVAAEIYLYRSLLVQDPSQFVNLFIDPSQVTANFAHTHHSPTFTGMQETRARLANGTECVAIGPLQASPALFSIFCVLDHPHLLECLGCIAGGQSSSSSSSSHSQSQSSDFLLFPKPEMTLTELLAAVGSNDFHLKRFGLRDRLLFACDLLSALVYIHSRGFAARRVSSDDVFFVFTPEFDPSEPRYEHCRVCFNPFIVHRDGRASEKHALDAEDYWAVAPERINWHFGASQSEHFTASADMYGWGMLLWTFLMCNNATEVLKFTASKEYPMSTKSKPDLSQPHFRGWFITRSSTPLPLSKNSKYTIALQGEVSHSLNGFSKAEQGAIYHILLKSWSDSSARISSEAAHRGLSRFLRTPSLQTLCIETIIVHELDSTVLPEKILSTFPQETLWY